jgi:hypothetical protein
MLVFCGRVVTAAAEKDTTGCSMQSSEVDRASCWEELWRGTTSVRLLASILRDDNERKHEQSLND